MSSVNNCFTNNFYDTTNMFKIETRRNQAWKDPYQLLSKEFSLHSSLCKTWQNHGKRQNNLLSLQGLKSGKIPWCWWVGDGDRWKVMTNGHENSFSVSTYSQKLMPIQTSQNQPLCCFSEQLQKKFQLKNPVSQVLFDRLPKQYCHYPYHVPLGGGIAT
jgi:hypothetical protein